MRRWGTKRKHSHKKRKSDLWYRIILIVCFLVFAGSVTKLFMIFHEYRSAQNEYEDLEDDFAVEGEPTTIVSGAAIATPEAVEEKPYVFEFTPLEIDFDSLKKTNEDIVGWIQFETFKLSYPIVQDNGDNFYLTHTFKKQKNASGSIFIGPSNNADFLDTNTIIFGHNMKDGSMFGLLGRYKNKSYFQANQSFRIYTPAGTKRYAIFSVYRADVEGSAYTIYSAPGGEEYAKWLNELKSLSMYDTGVTVGENDRIVTLSTCVSGQKQKRLVIHAKQIE